MSTARPFAYNTGTGITGTTQVGNLAVGIPDVGFSATGLEWWNGPDEDLGYVIACQVPTDTQPTPISGVTASVGFFRSEFLSEASFVNLTNQLFNQVFLTGDQCKTYLNSNGYWTSWGQVPSGMVLYLDTGVSSSYPGTGSTWYDLSGYGNNGTIHGAGYTGGTAAALIFNGTSSDYVDFSSVNQIPIGNEPYTISVWFNSDEMPSIRGFIGWGEFGSVNQVNAWRLQVVGGTSGFVHYWWGNDLTYATSMMTGTWYNAIAAYENGSRKIYLNNVKVAEDSPTGHNVPYASNLKIGVSYPGFNEWFDGKIAQVIIYKRQATDLEIEAIWNSGKNRFGYTDPVINLIMSLDSTLGVSGSSWADQSGNGNNATLYGGYGTTASNSNQVITLDGINAYVFPTSGFGTSLNSGFTYEVWACSTTPYNGTLISEWSGSNIPTGWNDAQMAFVSGTINVGVFDPLSFSPDPYLIGPSGYVNTWYNIVMTYDDSTGYLKEYVNGVLIGSTNGIKSNPSGTFLSLGRPDAALSYLGGATGYFQGYIGSWKIWDGPLSYTSILSNYNTSKSRYEGIVQSGLIIQLDADNSSSYPGSGTTVYDLSGSYNHTLTNSPFTTLNGIKCFDCNGTSNTYIRVNGTGPTLSAGGYTYISWAKVKTSSTNWRTLFRTAPDDHPILVEIGTDRLGFYDNGGGGFVYSGYDVTSIEDIWVQYSVVGDSSSSIFYINGTRVGTTAYGAGGNRHDYWGSISGQPFGYVANMYLYNRKLSQVEITQQYNYLSSRFI